MLNTEKILISLFSVNDCSAISFLCLLHVFAKILKAFYVIIMAPFEEDGVYCCAHVDFSRHQYIIMPGLVLEIKV